MRKELENIQTIEQYLLGNLSETDKITFETQLAADKNLQQQLATQQGLQQATNRIALKKELLGAKKSLRIKKMIKKGMITIAVIGAIGLSSWAIWSASQSKSNAVITQEVETVQVASEKTAERESGIENGVEKGIAEEEAAKESVEETVEKGDNGQVASSSAAGNVKNQAKKAGNDLIDYKGLKMWVEPAVQTFNIDPAVGRAIECEKGSVVIVPKNAFLDSKGEAVKSEVEVKIIEALTLDDMILYNLTTTADGKALQTGGMFHFEFTSNGSEVKVNPDSPLYVEVPVDEKKEGMMVFEGETSNGKLNWKNPKPLKKYLVNVDFELLDFLPENFSDTVEFNLPFRKHTEFSKNTVNEIYYGLRFDEVLADVSEPKKKFEGRVQTQKSFKNIFSKRGDKGDSASNVESATGSLNFVELHLEGVCGIYPSQIKAIKGREFSKTFLATKEFEERVNSLHDLAKGSEMFDVYVDNLAKDLSYSDSIVATKLEGSEKLVFEKFAAQRLTNVKDAKIYQAYLSQLYNKKIRTHQAAVKAYENRLASANQRELRVLKASYDKTLSNPFRPGSLTSVATTQTKGELTPPLQRPSNSVATSNVYAFQWSRGGWCNIDAYLHLLSKGSQDVSIKVAETEGTMEVYQYLSKVQNLTTLLVRSGVATVKVPLQGNEGSKEMENTYCVAIAKNGDEYRFAYKKYNPYEESSFSLTLEPMMIKDIRAKIRAYGVAQDVTRKIASVEKDIAIAKRRAAALELRKKKLAAIRKQKLAALEKKRKELKIENNKLISFNRVAFACCSDESVEVVDEAIQVLDSVQVGKFQQKGMLIE